MPREQKSIEQHLRDRTFDVSKHGPRAPAHVLASYRSAIGRHAGRDVACSEALAALEAGENVVGELHRAARATPAQLMAISYGGHMVEGKVIPERHALWLQVGSAREAYRVAVAGDEMSARYVTVPPLESPTEDVAVLAELDAKIAALPDHDIDSLPPDEWEKAIAKFAPLCTAGPLEADPELTRLPPRELARLAEPHLSV